MMMSMNNKLRILNRNIADVCIIADIHSSLKELQTVIKKSIDLGVTKFISVGDLWDRGPDPVGVTNLVAEMQNSGDLEVLLGNHDWKFIRHFAGQKVSIAEEQVETLRKLTQKSIDVFQGIFAELPVAIYDPAKKIFISHAAGGRPADVLGRDFQKSKEHNFASYNSYITDEADKVIDKKYVANLLYGITNGQVTENGRPVRLPLTTEVTDNLEGWRYVYGHHHLNCFYPENGNKNSICLDFCCGEPGGKLAGLIVRSDGVITEDSLIFS